MPDVAQTWRERLFWDLVDEYDCSWDMASAISLDLGIPNPLDVARWKLAVHGDSVVILGRRFSQVLSKGQKRPENGVRKRS